MKKNIGKYQKNLTKWELGKVQQMLEREYFLTKTDIRSLEWIYVPNQIENWDCDDLWIANCGSRKFLVRKSNIKGYGGLFVQEVFLYN